MYLEQEKFLYNQRGLGNKRCQHRVRYIFW